MGHKNRSTLARLHDRMESLFASTLCGILVVVTCLAISSEIVARLSFNYSFVGMTELVEQAVVMMTYLSLAAIQKEHGHLSMDLISRKLKKRPKGHLYESFLLFTCTVTYLALFVISTIYCFQSYKSHAQIMTLAWPKWAFMVAMPFGICLMVLRLALQLKRTFPNSKGSERAAIEANYMAKGEK